MALTRRYDSIFRRHAGRVPVNYLRALAKRESNLNPGDQKDPAWGLMQVVPHVLDSYNKRHGTRFSRQDLLNPDINVRIAADLLNRIATSYQKYAAQAPNLRENWSNPAFAELVTAGWNSGYSDKAGVGRVARYLIERGIPVTHDAVFAHSLAAGATRHLRNETKRGWQKSVARLFYEEGGPGISRALVALVVMGGGYIVYRLLRR